MSFISRSVMKVPLTYKQKNWLSVYRKSLYQVLNIRVLCQVTASLLETQMSCFTMCSPQMVKTACLHGMRKLRSDITCSMVCSCAATCVLPAPVTAPCGPAQWKLVSSNNSQKVENVWPQKNRYCLLEQCLQPPTILGTYTFKCTPMSSINNHQGWLL